MSKISQELKALLYLNDKFNRTKWVTIKELAQELEVTDRQARRYLEDLNLLPTVIIDTRLGRDGGYHLRKPLDKGIALPENMALAMSLSMKRNQKIESVLSELSNYISTDSIAGDNILDDEMLSKLETIYKAIKDQKELIFNYSDHLKRYYIQPYKIVLTNHTYYLFLLHKDELKKFDIKFISNIEVLGSFKPDSKILKTIEDKLSRYGLKDDGIFTLRVKCKDIKALETFDKYYEGKGVKNTQELTYVVKGNSENELYYSLFRISTKDYRFLDEDFKNKYLKYLENQINSIRRQ